ncbi:MAG TPA: hypothetical protein PLD27_01865 [bacterium]|nr:hypothetical protein [bacterium]HOL46710.1 hypothetical protein [bacterium]HPQ18398.1 hypothetical protein [bacterium]
MLNKKIQKTKDKTHLNIYDYFQDDDTYEIRAYYYFYKTLKKIKFRNKMIKAMDLISLITEKAVKDFGPMADLVFSKWHIYDVNDIIYIVERLLKIKNINLKIIKKDELPMRNVKVDILFRNKFEWLETI